MKGNFWITYVILVIAQMILYIYCRFTPYIILSLLPVMILCLPTSIGSFAAQLIAFGTGLVVDYFAEGVIGINAAALLPGALIRRPLISLMCGSEPFERQEGISIRKYGFARVSLAMLIAIVLFLIIYILLDCAGTRPAWFIFLALACSTAASYVMSLLIVNQLTYDDRR